MYCFRSSVKVACAVDADGAAPVVAGPVGAQGDNYYRCALAAQSVAILVGSKTLYTHFLEFENYKKEYFWI